jgi:hypothetical protein
MKRTSSRDASRLSAHHLARDPTLLRGQLHGRLLGVESLEIQNLLRDTGGRSPWLRCLTPSLTAPGGGLIRTLEGHLGPVLAVAMSGDGTRAVSGSGDEMLKVWDLTTGGVVASFAADYPLQCCASSPRGETLVAGDTSGRVHLLRLEGLGLGT